MPEVQGTLQKKLCVCQDPNCELDIYLHIKE